MDERRLRERLVEWTLECPVTDKEIREAAAGEGRKLTRDSYEVAVDLSRARLNYRQLTERIVDGEWKQGFFSYDGEEVPLLSEMPDACGLVVLPFFASEALKIDERIFLKKTADNNFPLCMAGFLVDENTLVLKNRWSHPRRYRRRNTDPEIWDWMCKPDRSTKYLWHIHDVRDDATRCEDGAWEFTRKLKCDPACEKEHEKLLILAPDPSPRKVAWNVEELLALVKKLTYKVTRCTTNTDHWKQLHSASVQNLRNYCAAFDVSVPKLPRVERVAAVRIARRLNVEKGE